MSKTVIGLLVSLAGYLFTALQIEVAPEDIQKALEAIVVLGGLGYSWYQRYKVGDIHWYGKRKSKSRK